MSTDSTKLRGCWCRDVYLSTDNTICEAVGVDMSELSTNSTIYEAVCVDMLELSTDNTLLRKFYMSLFSHTYGEKYYLFYKKVISLVMGRHSKS